MKKSLMIQVEPGLQARPAAQFVQKANAFVSEIFIEVENRRINAKSIMGLMSLALVKGTEVTLIANGPDEVQAIEELARFVSGE
ncbi:catabolite repression HPr-like protein [Gracilibacillus halotolerans]|uniref:Catabolite repression HPr-like protein n=1 Tax=Gracilibacillus halotolerans TaxID=74386 RepID=A0A841RQU8_9BACI|nr:HPr family phosphocarrier protein [Gracilibacillus halotolerans]MBB6513736.1 catabolite repression HPr-like protein [Gracilibacillus halotolerans]